jgi:hypothetical protein
MALKQCDKCSEMVDEAKAFCPGCGSSFETEEKRQDASGFDSLDHTVQLGQTMYNQMLSDMGLNISKAPNPDEKHTEVAEPKAAEPTAIGPPDSIPAEPVPANNKTWLVLGGIGVALLFLLVLAAFILLFVLWSRPG